MALLLLTIYVTELPYGLTQFTRNGHEEVEKVHNIVSTYN